MGACWTGSVYGISRLTRGIVGDDPTALCPGSDASEKAPSALPAGLSSFGTLARNLPMIERLPAPLSDPWVAGVSCRGRQAGSAEGGLQRVPTELSCE
jgi:hypothetical protein